MDKLTFMEQSKRPDIEHSFDPFIHSLSQSARLASQHLSVALKQMNDLEILANEAGYDLNRLTGELVKRKPRDQISK